MVLFILSLSSAGLSLYLSNIRENEKEKRIFLEGVKTDLETRLGKVEQDKSQLSQKVDDLQEENKKIAGQLKQEQKAKEEALALAAEKETELEGLRGEAKQAQFAFKDAQKRNQELERILDELEVRMRQIEGQGQMPNSEVGYIEVKPAAPEAQQSPAPDQAVTPAKPEQTADVTFKPLTALPEPPKKRRFLSFLGSSGDEKNPESTDNKAESVAVTQKIETSAPIRMPAEPVHSAQPAEPVQVKTETPASVQKTDQAIAAGSVLLVNRKYNFVVINLGSRQSLGLEDIITIQQEGKEIAKARVEKVYDDYSAAYIIEEQTEHPITEGNPVSRV